MAQADTYRPSRPKVTAKRPPTYTRPDARPEQQPKRQPQRPPAYGGGYNPTVAPTAAPSGMPAWLGNVANWLKNLNSNVPVGGRYSPAYQPNSPSAPSWYVTERPDTYNAAPAQPTPTGSFIGGGGQVVLGPQQTAVPSTIPTGSFLGGGGQYVLGPNQRAYLRKPGVTGTFIGAGGEAVRGPDTTIMLDHPPAGGGGDGSYGYRRRGGGGGGDGDRYPPYPQRVAEENMPAWYRGLANWSIG
jgi:hypothetical protein